MSNVEEGLFNAGENEKSPVIIRVIPRHARLLAQELGEQFSVGVSDQIEEFLLRSDIEGIEAIGFSRKLGNFLSVHVFNDLSDLGRADKSPRVIIAQAYRETIEAI